MATLAFAAVGTAVGTAVGGSVSFLGATLTAAAIGQTLGSIAGSYVDSYLLGSAAQGKPADGPRLSDLQVQASTEGAPIPRIYGRTKVAGQIMWATNFEEEVGSQSTGGGKGLNTGSASQTVYRYYANFAIGLCEGEIARIGRVWADGDEVTLTDYNFRFYTGTEDQTVDSLIETKEGAGNAPAYRGLCYIVFERLPLESFGNRIPQFNFEVFRAVDTFEEDVLGVTLIPAAGEFAYHPTEVRVDAGGGTSYSENNHTNLAVTDFAASIDQLEEVLPNCATVSIFTAWFGTDLRCGNCEIHPKVDNDQKGNGTTPISWSVAGRVRSNALVVSDHDGRPAFGGTPSDNTIVAAIKDLKTRGYDVILTPFILVDIPDGNTLTDPYTGSSGQPVYPWRGRITCNPAPGETGTPDQTSAAATQVDDFYGTVDASDFSVDTGAGTVSYTGPNEWSYSRCILHNAALCAAAGGVAAFIIGSEMRGLTWVRESASSYPFVDHLITLAAQVKLIFSNASLSEPDVTYAADWSEYFGHQPTDGSNDVYFHLDPLWSDSNIDAVALDNYWPLSDWREGTDHLDYQAGTRFIHELAYLKGNIEGGEGYDYYYASTTDRENQTRTPITDGGGKPWVFRTKDINSWWSNQHYNRPGGTESGSPTSWVPESKPIWFTEIGCPAIDKGSNQPNVFYDPKSSESFVPYFSKGVRDDLIQRRFLRAFLEWYDENHAAFVETNNPESSVYSGRMVDTSKILIYTWDARPYPAFPALTTIWSDGDNWQYGHWLTGRISDAPIAELVATMLTDFGMSNFNTAELVGLARGYYIDRVMSARDAIQPLELSFFFDAYESQGTIRFRHRGAAGVVDTLTPDDLIEESPGSNRYELIRAQESELPSTIKLTYQDVGKDYEQGSAEAKRQVGNSHRVSQAALPVAMTYADAIETAEIWLHELWASREKGSLAFPPSRLAVETTDVVTLTAMGRDFTFRIVGQTFGEKIDAELISISPHIYGRYIGGDRPDTPTDPTIYGAAIAAFMDLPLISGAETPYAGHVAAYGDPWPGGVAFYRSPTVSDYTTNIVVASPAKLGATQFDFYSGPTGRWDYGNIVRVQMFNGELSSVSEIVALGGANLMAIENADGEWEIIQFRNVALISPGVYDLSTFLRGQFGTEGAMRSPVASGARVVLIDSAIKEVLMAVDERGLEFNWKWGPSSYPIDHPSIQTAAHTFNGVGLRPYSPVHVSGEFDGNDIDISWIRRTRLGGDSWEQTEVPVNEETQSYEIDIMDGVNVVRTLTSSTQSVTYTEAQQITDFGSVQSSYAVRVYQLSATFGRGQVREATIP